MVFMHGIEVKESAEIGAPISADSQTVVGILLAGAPAEGGEKKWQVVRSYSQIDDVIRAIFGAENAEASQYLKAMFTESFGITLVYAAPEMKKDSAQLFKQAVVDTGYKPTIVVAPGVHDAATVAALNSVAAELYAVYVADVSGDKTLNGALANTYAVYGTYTEAGNAYPLSVNVAGLMRKVDMQRGYWVSPSNKTLTSVGADADIVQATFPTAPEDPANEKNAKNINCLIYHEGPRLWGNRLASGEFIAVKRTKMFILSRIETAVVWGVDEPINPGLVALLESSVNAFLRDLKQQGAILEGQAKALDEYNTPERLQQGKLRVDLEIKPVYPAEHLKFVLSIAKNKVEEVG